MNTLKDAFADYHKQFPDKSSFDEKDARHFVEWLKDRAAERGEPITSDSTNPTKRFDKVEEDDYCG